MNARAIRLPVLADHVWGGGGLARAVWLAAGGSLAIALAAKVQVPFWPVPMTMQSLVVLLIGIAYGSRLAAATVLTYLAEGLLGIPVFAGATAGPAYLAGPTGGFLLGFVLAATFVGFLAERGWDRSVGGATAAMTLGHVLLFVPGVVWLAVLFGWTKAFAVGVTPFIPSTIVKIALGVALVAAGWSLTGRRRSRES